MAGLTKTYSGDFGEFIAGKIWNVIKEIDEEKKAEENQASKDVKDAAKKLSKDDKDSVPVKDKDLRDTVANIFLPLEVKLSKASSNVDGMSAKITAVGGSISDTQKLVIHQNEILEDKLDTMLGVLVRRNDTLDKLREDKIYEQLELALEEGIDVAGFGDIEKTSAGGGSSIMSSLFWGVFRDVLQGRGQGKGAGGLTSGGLRKRLFKLFRVKRITAKALRAVARVLPPNVLAKILGATIMTPELGRIIAKEYIPSGVSPAMRHLAKTKGLDLLPGQSAWSKTANKPWTSADGVAALNRVIAGETSDQALSNVAKAGGKKALKKGGKRAAVGAAVKGFQDRIQGSILGAFFSSPKAQKLLVNKLGKEAAEELGLKAAKGMVKSGVPLVGTAIGAIEGIARLLMGDPKGMLLSFGSAIPMAGWGFTIIDILRDIDKDAYESHIEPNYPFPSDTDFARFFMDAVGITPDQFERGTGHVAPANVGLSSIQEIVGATLAIGQAAGIDTKTLVSDAGLGSVKPKGTYNFDISPTGGGKTIATQTKMVEDRELPKIKKLKKGDDEEEVSTEEQIKIWEKMSKTGKLPEGGSGSGGNLIASHSSLVPHGHPTVRIDASGEPGVDFTPDGAYNRAVFDGVVTEIGHQYNPNVIGGDGRMGAGYGHYIAVTGTDPATGEKFDAVYAHFPEGELNRWKLGDTVNYGDVLGLMGTSADYANPETRKHVGSGTGPHTSLDFFKPGSTAAYPQWRGLVDRIDPSFTPKPALGPPPPLPPIDNISAVTSNQTNLVDKGSSERLIAKRKANFSSPVIMVNNNVMTATASPIIVSSGGSEFSVKDIQYARLAT